MSKKTSADYQRAFRQRLRAQGLKKKEVWIRPEHEQLLAEIEAQLRHPAAALQEGESMEQQKDSWQTDALCQQLQQMPLYQSGKATAEYLDGSAPSILVTLHDYGDLPIYVAVAGAQILVEAVLFPVAIIRDQAAFNTAILETHKYFPLSTISIEHTESGEAYYNVFGSLSSASGIEDIALEIDMVASNVLLALEAYEEFLPAKTEHQS